MEVKKWSLFYLYILTIILAGCSIEEIQDNNEAEMQGDSIELTGTIELQAEPGYIKPDNEEDASVYIINTHANTVYIDGKGKSYTKDDLENIGESMTGEELEEMFGNMEADDPEHEITFLEATKDEIILEYDDKRIVFTGLSDSFFQSDTGIHYRITGNTSVSEYKADLRGE